MFGKAKETLKIEEKSNAKKKRKEETQEFDFLKGEDESYCEEENDSDSSGYGTF